MLVDYHTEKFKLNRSTCNMIEQRFSVNQTYLNHKQTFLTYFLISFMKTAV